MKLMLRKFVYDNLLLYRLYRTVKDWRAVCHWLADPVLMSSPPHPVKEVQLLKYARHFKITQLVETGTYLGDTADKLKRHFTSIYTVELNDYLFARAKRIFKKYPHIKVVQGDSGKVLPQVLANIKKPTIFWLDGHYCGDITSHADLSTPIEEELRHIAANMKKHKIKHVMCIDDARLFIGKDSYPTLKEMYAICEKLFPGYMLNREEDIFCLSPPVQ